MIGRPHILALVSDAFGARGGIAQYNRDFIAALAACPTVGAIDILPRQCAGVVDALPERTRQFKAVQGRLDYSIRAFALAARRRPDIVFCGHLYMAPLAAFIARAFRAKLVVQVHGVEIWSRPTRVRRRALEAADLVLCVSRDTRAWVVGWTMVASERVAVLPNTVAEVFTPGDGSALRVQMGLQDKTVLLSVGRLSDNERKKGQDRVIGRLAALGDQGRNVVFLIGGDGDDRPRLEALARKAGVADQVRFLGEVAPGDLVDLYRAADLFVMPSTGEGFGIVYLEAMACGVPALGLAVGGAPDALGEGVAATEDDFDAALARCLGATRPDPYKLAAAVRRRFGRPVFQARAARTIARLTGSDEAMAA